MNDNWREYDPQWLVELAVARFPHETAFHDALRKCTRCIDQDEVVFFVDRMEGKFAYNVVMITPDKGKLVLDVLKDGRVASLEILPVSAQEALEGTE